MRSSIAFLSVGRRASTSMTWSAWTFSEDSRSLKSVATLIVIRFYINEVNMKASVSNRLSIRSVDRLQFRTRSYTTACLASKLIILALVACPVKWSTGRCRTSSQSMDHPIPSSSAMVTRIRWACFHLRLKAMLQVATVNWTAVKRGQ